MKTALCLVPLAGLFCMPSIAAPSAEADDSASVTSRITEVTVYADRAQVTRSAAVTVREGAGRYAFAALPGWIDEGSIRVTVIPPEAGRLLDVQVKRTYLTRSSDEDVRKAETASRELGDQMAALDDEKTVLDARAKQIESIRAFSIEKLPKDMASREVKPAEYGQTVDFITESLRDIARQRRDLAAKRRDLEPELAVRQRRLDDVRQSAQIEQRVVVVTLAGSGKPASLAISYMLPGATWEPAHELRAQPDSKAVDLASFAVVMQTTGEDWSGVKLFLSTQKSTETLKIPELGALTVGGRHLARVITRGKDTFDEANRNWMAQNGAWFELNNPAKSVQTEYRGNQELLAENTRRVGEIFEVLQQRGTSAHFAALADQTIRSDGRAVRVPIGQGTLEAQHRIVAAPEMSLNAARTVDLTNTARQPVLPGHVSLFVGGSFLGLTETEFVAPGESFSLYLGVADHIKLSRTLDKKRSALTRGGSRTRMQVSFLVTVENLADAPVALQLADRVPVSETDEVRVSGVRIQPDGKPDPKGMLRWDLALNPKQSREFRIEYTVDYPNEVLVRPTPAKSSMSPSAAPESSVELFDQIRTLETKF